MRKNKKTTKSEIIKKSWDLFDKNSFFNLSMQDFAKNLNIGKSHLYYYFRNKSELIYDVIYQNIDTIIKQFDIIFNSNQCPTKKIHKLSMLYIKNIKNKSVMTSNNENKIDQSVVCLINNYENIILGYFEKILHEGIKKGVFKQSDPKNLSLAILGYLEKINDKNIKNNQNWLEFIYK